MKPVRVLQFEDAAVDRLLVAQSLGSAGGAPFELTQVVRLAEGIAHLHAHAADAILLDLSLPDSQGVGTFIEVNAAAPETPILVLTGCTDEAMGDELVKAGAQDFLPKSEVSGGMLARAIRYAIERKHAQHTLRRAAWHDPLTGLPNRNLLADRTRQLLALAKRNGERIALLFIDLDGFKTINDSLGHDAGDAVLKAVAERLTTVLRKSDTVARLGGDEFVIVAPQLILASDAARIADKLLVAVKSPIIAGGQSVTVGVSIGISVYPEDGDDVDDLITAADAAMYKVKHLGRNGYAFFSSATPASATDHPPEHTVSE